MKTFTLNEQHFELETSVHKFLSDYVQRINTFVEKNAIDSDLHQDILQRLTDKLLEKQQSKNGITQKVAITIVNDLGEPEDIFGDNDFEEEKKSDKRKKASPPFYENLQKNAQSRPQENAILLGVGAMFAQAAGMKKGSARVWRGLALLASWIFLASGFGKPFILGRCTYLLFALIFPRTEKNYGHRSVFSYFLTQIWDLRLAISNSIKRGFNMCIWIVKVAIPFCISMLKKLFGPLWKIIRRCFLIGRTGFLLLIIAGGVVGLYYFITKPIIAHVNIMSIIPKITIVGVIFGIIAAILLVIRSVGIVTNNKKLISSIGLALALISGVIGLTIGGISTGKIRYRIKSIHNYQFDFEKEMLISLDENGTPLTIDVQRSAFPEGWFGDAINHSRIINYLPYEGNEIKAIFSYAIEADTEETLNRIKENLSDPAYTMKDGKLKIFYKGNQLFDGTVPFALVKYGIDLYIPQDLQFNLTNSLGNTNIDLPDWIKEYGYYGNLFGCSNGIRYNKENNNFYCHIPFDLKNSNIRGIIEKDIRNNKTDELSPLQGLNDERSNTYKNQQYWMLHSVLRKSDQRMIVKLSDKMFNLFLEVEATMDGMGNITYSKPILKQVEQKGRMNHERMKDYSGREHLIGFDIQIEEEKKSEEPVSQEVFDALVKKLEEKGILNEEEK